MKVATINISVLTELSLVSNSFKELVPKRYFLQEMNSVNFTGTYLALPLIHQPKAPGFRNTVNGSAEYSNASIPYLLATTVSKSSIQSIRKNFP